MSENPARKFYDRMSAVYDVIADEGEHAARERGLELLDAQPGERVLEIGFGTGHSLVRLAQAVGDRGHVDGIDISAGMCHVAQRRIAEHGLEARVTLKVAETPPLPYDDVTFDAVTMSFTLELFPLEEISAVLREIARVLRDGGRAGIVSMATTPADQKDSFLERSYTWMHRHFPHIVDCQPIPLETLVVGAGFELTKTERLSLFTMPVAALVGTCRAGSILAAPSAAQSAQSA